MFKFIMLSESIAKYTFLIYISCHAEKWVRMSTVKAWQLYYKIKEGGSILSFTAVYITGTKEYWAFILFFPVEYHPWLAVLTLPSKVAVLFDSHLLDSHKFSIAVKKEQVREREVAAKVEEKSVFCFLIFAIFKKYIYISVFYKILCKPKRWLCV